MNCKSVVMTILENVYVQSYIFRFLMACLKNTLAYNKLITMVVKIKRYYLSKN